MSDLKKIEMTAYSVKQSLDYEVTYFNAKDANEAAEEAREELQKSVKAYRAYQQGQVTLQALVNTDYEKYKKLVNQAKAISRRYAEQCHNRAIAT